MQAPSKRTNIFIYTLSLVLALLAGEAILRLAGARLSSSFYVLDQDRGWALRPEARGDNTQENTVAIEINAAGQRDHIEHSLAKPPGTYRVVILGDSFAEAFQVPLEQSIAKQLEKELNSCLGGQRAEVINFAVGGYGTQQEILTYRLQAKQYSPDMVILLFYTGNDLYNNHPKLNPTNADAAPYFDRPALAKPSALREGWAQINRHSHLARMISDIYYKARRNNSADERRRVQEFGENYMNKLAFSPPTHPEMIHAWGSTEEALRVFPKEVTSKFLLAVASSNFQVNPELDKRSGFLAFSGATELFYAEKRLAALGLPTLLLGPPMLEAAEAQGTYFHGFAGSLGSGHWNAEGHAMAAKLISRRICN